MFGCKPLLPIDVKLGVHVTNVADASSAKYEAKVHKKMKWAFQQVTTFNEKEINCAKKQYDQNMGCSVLAPSDQVLVCVKAFKENTRPQIDGKVFLMKLLDVLEMTFLYMRLDRMILTSSHGFSTGTCSFLLFNAMRVSQVK